jgi:surface adhesion protein
MNNSSVKLIGTAEFPEVTVSISPHGDVLENMPAAFTLTLSMPVGEDMLVTLSNGAMVTIPAGSSSVVYTNGTQGDDVFIDPGMISVSITSAVPASPIMAAVIVDTDPAVVNVTDTIDPVIVRLSATPSTSEPAAPSTRSE